MTKIAKAFALVLATGFNMAASARGSTAHVKTSSKSRADRDTAIRAKLSDSDIENVEIEHDDTSSVEARGRAVILFGDIETPYRKRYLTILAAGPLDWLVENGFDVLITKHANTADAVAAANDSTTSVFVWMAHADEDKDTHGSDMRRVAPAKFYPTDAAHSGIRLFTVLSCFGGIIAEQGGYPGATQAAVRGNRTKITVNIVADYFRDAFINDVQEVYEGRAQTVRGLGV